MVSWWIFPVVRIIADFVVGVLRFQGSIWAHEFTGFQRACAQALHRGWFAEKISRHHAL
jgi:hypothetical protein